MLRTRLHVADRILRYSTEINVLQDLIPICAYCHNVRDGADYWERVDTYIRCQDGHPLQPYRLPGLLRRADQNSRRQTALRCFEGRARFLTG